MTSPTRPSLSLEQFVIGLFHGLAQRGYTHILRSDVGGTHVAANRAYQRIYHQYQDFIHLEFGLMIDPVFHEAEGWNEIIKKAADPKTGFLMPYLTEHTLMFNQERLAILIQDVPGAPEVWQAAVDAFIGTKLPVAFLRKGSPVE